MRALAFAVALLAGLFGAVGPGEASTAPRLAFWQKLPPSARSYLADDIKLLVGWTFDAAASQTSFEPYQIVDKQSSFASVPGFAAPTPMGALKGRYRIERAFDNPRGYYGIEFIALGERGEPVAVLLVNRLFRMPIAHRDPLGVLTDVVTVGAMLIGLETPAIAHAKAAAETAFNDAKALGVPLIAAGQSQAGGTAQLQVAHVQARQPGSDVGFITFNAAHVLLSVRRLGFAGTDLGGVNFSKDLDPGVGPKAPFANRVGFQVYIHRDGSGGNRPGDTTLLDALLHPREHFLDSFNDVSVTAALAVALGQG